MSEPDLYLLEVHDEKANSWKVSDGKGHVVYLPKSQVETDRVNQSKRGNTLYEFQVPEWLAREKGFI